MRWPVDKVSISSPYGDRNYKGELEFHSGIDLRPEKRGVPGDKIYSMANGVVRVAKANKGGFGLYVVVEHPHLGICSMYCHLSSLRTKVGQEVQAGDVIGLMGNSGRSSAVHSHFEIRPVTYDKFWAKQTIYGNVEPLYSVDPVKYLADNGIPIPS